MAQALALPVSTVTVRYYGPTGGTASWYYWVQAIFPGGYSPLSPYGLVTQSQPSLNAQMFNVVTWDEVVGAIGYKVWRTTTSAPPTSGPFMLAQIGDAGTSLTDNGYNWQISNDTVVVGVDVNGDANITGTYYVNGVPAGGGGGGAVSSVFNRVGNVVAVAGDYTAALVTNAVDSSQTYANPAWITNLAWSKITGAPTMVTSTFGRTGAVIAQAGDYTAAMVGAPPATRLINTSTGLTGGGDLSADRTLSVVADTTNQQVQALHAAVLAGTRHALNFVDTASASWTIADNPGSNRIDISVTAATSGGGLADPTTTLGDLLVRGSTTVQRLGVGTDAYVLTADHTQPLGIKWAVAASAPVSSVFTRTGAVVAATGDYTAAQVTNAVDSTQSYTNPTWIVSLPYSKITGAPTIPVTSVFTRTGAIVATTGDYTAAQVTNAVDASQTYANPTWLTALAWSKITGAPAIVNSISPGILSGAVTLTGGTGISVTQSSQTITIATAAAAQTPWLQNIDGGGYYLTHTGSLRISASSNAAPQYMLDIGGAGVSATHMHISYDGTDTGCYLATGAVGNFILTSDLVFSASGQYIPRAASWGMIGCGNNGFGVYQGTGATVGSPITLPTPVIYAAGQSVGISTTTPATTLQVIGTIIGPPVLGTASGAFSVMPNAAAWGLFFGGLNTGESWMQSMRTDSATAYSVLLQPSGGNVGIGMAAPSYQLQLSSDSAAKPSTNTWTIASDIRLKKNVRPFTEGLATVRQIEPIRYRYTGEGGLPEDEGVGLDARAHKDILPDCITEHDNLYYFNSHALTFVLINAVQELAARLEKLGG